MRYAPVTHKHFMSWMNVLLDWMERHRHGVVGTLLVHAVLLFVLMLWQLPKVAPEAERSEIRVEIVPTEMAEEMEERIAQEMEETTGEVRSLTSNIAAEVLDRPALSRAAQQRMEQVVEQDLRDLEQAEFDRLAEERRERGEEIVMPELDPSKWDKELYMDRAVEPARVEGATAVWHDLQDPLRAERSINIPAFKCKGFGQVVIIVAVGRDGRVRNAEVDLQRTKASDPCTLDEALRSARNATFHPHAGAPDNQRGAIYYRFTPQ